MAKINAFKFKSAINLYAITDAHIGSKAHDAVKFKKTITQIKKDPNAYCFFNGDNIELIPPNYGIPEGGQEFSVDEQVREFTDLLKSLGKKVLFIRAGNHENRAANLLGFDLAAFLGKELKIPALHVGMEEVHIYIGKTKLRIVTSHGEGGGSKRVLNNMQLSFPGADLYVSGHTHEKYVNAGNLTVDTSSGEEVLRPQIECVGGSFLNWADYARGKNMRPTETGCFIFHCGDKGIFLNGVM